MTVSLLRLLAATLLLTGTLLHSAELGSKVKVDAIYKNGNIETMDDQGSKAEAVAISNGLFAGVGSTADILAKFDSDNIVDLNGDTMLPGFIDTHSHLQAWGGLQDPRFWLDLSSVNVFEKPLPGDPRCDAHNGDPQYCFIPVQTQEDVIARLQNAVQKAKPREWVLATLYEPARLGHGPTCPAPESNVAFQCPNFENGHALEYLDAISRLNPILIGSQSGHIAYANSAMMFWLNICGTTFEHKLWKCHQAELFPEMEVAMANLGQLNEDLNGYALSIAGAHILLSDSAFAERAFTAGLEGFANHGYTLAQEGVASDPHVVTYLGRSTTKDFPLTAAILYSDGSTPDKFEAELNKLKFYRKWTIDTKNQNLIIQGIKEFADGSNQGYTGLMLQPYFNYYYPFTDPTIFSPDLFGDPYLGIKDNKTTYIRQHARALHEAGFPIAIHQNGDGGIAYTLAGLSPVAAAKPGVRDIMIHFSMASKPNLQTAKNMDAGVTFLITNLYYYGQPLCHQVLGPERTIPIYPTGWARDAGLRFSIHPDAPVGPPNPLFMIWIAKTRQTQQLAWYPPDPNCPVNMGLDEQGISIRQGVKAFTIDAAYVYGLEKQYGSIETGKFADLVRLSEDPLALEAIPDELKNVRVIGTVHHGTYRANSNPGAPVWPD